MTGVQDIRDAFTRLFLSIDGIQAEIGNFSNPDAPIADDEVPGFFVHRTSRAEHSRSSAEEYQTTRVFLIVLVVSKIPDGDPAGKETAYDDLPDFQDTVPKALLQPLALKDASGNPLEGVVGITRVVDDVPEEIMRERVRYTALHYHISVTMNQSL